VRSYSSLFSIFRFADQQKYASAQYKQYLVEY
jgi:hypothetical protein